MLNFVNVYVYNGTTTHIEVFSSLKAAIKESKGWVQHEDWDDGKDDVQTFSINREDQTSKAVITSGRLWKWREQFRKQKEEANDDAS